MMSIVHPLKARLQRLAPPLLVCILFTLILNSCAVVTTTRSAAAPGPHALGSNKHLFIDEALLDSVTGARLQVNPPQRRELVLIADRPWERHGITSYGNVFYDPIAKQYRMYYVPIQLDVPPAFMTCLATSNDGIHWEKPNFGAIEWEGSTDNNIVVLGQREGTVLIDASATPARRYAYLSSEGKLGTRLFTSPDGIHFTMDEAQISRHHSDSQIATFWDDQRNLFVHYFKVVGRVSTNGKRNEDSAEVEEDWYLSPKVVTSPNIPYPQNEPLLRAVGHYASPRMDDLWDGPFRIVMARDPGDVTGMDLYTNAAIKYAPAPDTYFAFPTPYYHYNHPSRKYLNDAALSVKGKTNDGKIETQLAVSRDGLNWIRYRTPYVPLYNHEGLDLKISMMYPGLLIHERTIDQYYAGYTFTHGDTQARRRFKGRELGGVFRVEQRLDGFVSLDFDYGGGEVVTKPFTFKGDRLQLNLNTSAAGEGAVAILDAQGSPIEPFTLANCRLINGDYINKTVEWAGSPSVADLSGRTIRLQFAMRGTQLYSFQFPQGASTAKE